MLNLDPTIVNQDKIRLTRRKKMLKISILPVSLLVLIGLFFLRTGFFNIIYGLSYGNRNYDTPVSISSFQLFGNNIEPYLAYYNRGTAELNLTQYDEAEKDFRASLRENPPRDTYCMVCVNLSYSIEMQADRVAQRKMFDDALVLYNRAESILFENNCASKSDDISGNDKKAEESKERIDNKRRRVIAQMNNDNDGGDDENIPGGDEVTNKEIEEIMNRLNPDNGLYEIQSGLSIKGSSGSNSNQQRW